MRIDRAQVEKLAELARLTLEEGEAERYQEELGGILAHFETLAALDVEGIEPTMHGLQTRGPGRADEPAPSTPRRELLAGAPEVSAGCFKVPRVI